MVWSLECTSAARPAFCSAGSSSRCVYSAWVFSSVSGVRSWWAASAMKRWRMASWFSSSDSAVFSAITSGCSSFCTLFTSSCSDGSPARAFSVLRSRPSGRSARLMPMATSMAATAPISHCCASDSVNSRRASDARDSVVSPTCTSNRRWLPA